MSFFGELYVRSTLPFLSAEITAREVAYLERCFTDLALAGPVVDLGCGHGRHAAPLNTSGVLAGRVVGLELDAYSLAHRLPGFPVVEGDLRALPFPSASWAGAYAWYSTLFAFSDAEHRVILREVARCLQPGAVLVFQTVPYERLLEQPSASFQRVLPDGSRLEEESHFEPATGRDHGRRRLITPEGRVLSGEYAIRYHPLPELVQRMEEAGLRVKWVHGGLEGEPLTSASTDLIMGAELRHG
ncbi:class I SAM-dependent methyltransferase [Stigmatella sp. ncwal1]|uniref:Class I SAM-dependent methyltransferase n=1 Tax=Stigmatella ashevillensis TaxID=2995309 RepID=A0ABT5D1J1_9BACT|nr:class I SAM-dependent methyltransferase [Stigmatella ashevillena]MDC0707528.1 class I SAM-dependent methyltransferase [Stigmatella ashevillena]